MRYQNIILLALILISAMTVLLAGPVISFFIPVMHAELGIPLDSEDEYEKQDKGSLPH